MDRERLLREAAQNELTCNILPFWRRTLDEEHGGFHGRVNGSGSVDRQAPRGLVLTARILWTYAAAYRLLSGETYLVMADHAFDYLVGRFRDHRLGGYYWMLDYTSYPVDTTKELYGQSFVLYALCEYHRATDEPRALDEAVRLFTLLEERCHDATNLGYVESHHRDWEVNPQPIISGGRHAKSMNTHLHMLEAYTNLYRVHRAPAVEQRLRELVGLFLTRITDVKRGHLIQYFTADWRPTAEGDSYGHDIEASWLLVEAAHVMGDHELEAEVRKVALTLADAVLAEALDEDGGLLYERSHGHLDDAKHWWPQSEALVGFLNAYQLTGDLRFLYGCLRSWAFIGRHLVDREGGEWFSKVDRNGAPDRRLPKADPWKCPYHNGRACMEVMERLGRK